MILGRTDAWNIIVAEFNHATGNNFDVKSLKKRWQNQKRTYNPNQSEIGEIPKKVEENSEEQHETSEEIVKTEIPKEISCDEKISSGSLKVELEKVKGKTKKLQLYSCEVCGKKFKNYYVFKNHARICHKGIN